MPSINRQALLLAPRPPLLEWVNGIFPESPLETDMDPLEHDNATIYLIPEFYSIEESLEWLEQNYIHFFEMELMGWCEDESLWPEDRSWDRFQEWFYNSVISVVEKNVDGAIEELDESEWEGE